jgi:MoaA/NifB/PqqE/SkfB family radical SAM enzyme
MIKENDIDFLVSLGMRSIFFSFDGSSPDVNDAIRGEGVFEKALATMQMFIEEKKKQKSPVRINVNTVLNRMNASNIPEIIDFCAYHGVNSYKLSHIDMIGNAETNSNSLYLTPREEFRAVERAIKSVQKYPEIQFSILSTKPKFLEYIYKKYGVAFPVNICGCKACIKEIYIDPTGHISPCLSTYEGFSKLLHNEDINYKIDIFESDDRPLAKYPFYKEFRRAFPLVKKTYKNYVPCNSCPYLATLCYPCPLGSTTNVNRDELCLIADEKLNEMEAS